MKKLFAKVILFMIISSLMIMTSYAQPPPNPPDPDATPSNTSDSSQAAQDLTKVFDDVINNIKKMTKTDANGQGPCIEEDGDDKGYIWVITEEPLSTATKDQDKVGAEYKVRNCFRNYISYVKKGKQSINTVLAKKCADPIKNGTLQAKMDEINKLKNSDIKITGFGCSEVQVHLSKGGTGLLTGYIRTIYIWAASLVGVISVTVIILSGIQLSLAGGDTQVVENAKGRIIKSLSGIALLFLSGLILYTINPTFFVK